MPIQYGDQFIGFKIFKNLCLTDIDTVYFCYLKKQQYCFILVNSKFKLDLLFVLKVSDRNGCLDLEIFTIIFTIILSVMSSYLVAYDSVIWGAQRVPQRDLGV